MLFTIFICPESMMCLLSQEKLEEMYLFADTDCDGYWSKAKFPKSVTAQRSLLNGKASITFNDFPLHLWPFYLCNAFGKFGPYQQLCSVFPSQNQCLFHFVCTLVQHVIQSCLN